MLILDIGCGVKKVAGAIGIDFSSLSDADVVINLNHERLPFDDSSVDFIYLSHTLKHLSFDGFFHVMSESYRILKPCADFKSVVQNFTTSVNLVNPFHNKNICFSERTFRFFSSEFPKHKYQTPSCPDWGLGYSANSEIGIEFKTLHIDKFYFSHYVEKNEPDKVSARSSKLNVIEQISYSLQAVKPCPIRLEAGPVAPLDDQYFFVERQLYFLADQLTYLHGQVICSSPEIDHGRLLVDSRRGGAVLHRRNFDSH